MGKSKTIEQKMKDDQKFREYMNQLDQDSKKEEEKIFKTIKENITSHYEGNGWDHARFFGNRNSDYQNYDDWSLARINNMVDMIGNALSDGNFPSKEVPGSEGAEESTVEDAKDFLGAFQGDYSLIIKRVKAIISGVLTQFATASKTSRKTTFKDMPLSGGLHLFFGSTGEVFTNNTFFTNQYIGSFQIVFEVMMSVDEAQAIGVQQILATTEQELSILKSLILDARKASAESLKKILKEDPEKYVATKATYDLILADLKKDRAEVMLEYDKYNQVTNTIDHLYTETATNELVSSAPKHDLKNIFSEWEFGIAKRYINEKYNNTALID
ncbi:hypothetical protein JM658_15925 [Joostella atrarenae]|uniref:Uncharacterized protein n=1 Tax=Joostella atrarenae TaxID=679257 RepID=A0ABS9J7C2_9FLAO|nr:hypothetical protein [Joostella atrarenae]MCF8716319.1 hypothetical protein [Joostella atrarenae]